MKVTVFSIKKGGCEVIGTSFPAAGICEGGFNPMIDTTSYNQKHLCESSCIISPEFKEKNGCTTSGSLDGKNGDLLQHPIQEAMLDPKYLNIQEK